MRGPTQVAELQVSVLITAYNKGPYVAEAIESALAQSYRPLEVVVVDDGSTDDTAAVLKGFSRRIRYHRQDNMGISGARNTAFELAQGDTIAFLDGDDLWPESSLEVRVNALAADRALGGVWGLVEQFLSPDVPEEIRGTLAVPPGARAGRLVGSMLLRRKTIETVGPFDPELAVGETMDWVARADAEGILMSTVSETVLRRRISGENTVLAPESDRAAYLRVLRSAVLRKRAKEGKG